MSIQALTIVNEGTTSYIRASFFDREGNALVPSVIFYRINDESTGQPLVEPTSVPTAAEIEIRVPPEVNSLVMDESTEIRVATIEAAYGDGDAVNAEVRWCVRNLKFKC